PVVLLYSTVSVSRPVVLLYSTVSVSRPVVLLYSTVSVLDQWFYSTLLCLFIVFVCFVPFSGGRLSVSTTHTPGSLFPVGETVVSYTATDQAGNNRTCHLTITVQGSTCEQPFVPVNGEFSCSEEEDGVNCTLYCKDGYSFTQQDVHSYFCANNGVWEPPHSPDRPDCSLNRIANHGIKPFEMLFKASRCGDLDLVKSFTGEFSTKLGDMVRTQESRRMGQ
ncbi:unnamed protein product, partial [Oncorhynchus mykiss]